MIILVLTPTNHSSRIAFSEELYQICSVFQPIMDEHFMFTARHTSQVMIYSFPALVGRLVFFKFKNRFTLINGEIWGGGIHQWLSEPSLQLWHWIGWRKSPPRHALYNCSQLEKTALSNDACVISPAQLQLQGTLSADLNLAVHMQTLRNKQK